MLGTEFGEMAIEARKRNRTDDLSILRAHNENLHSSQSEFFFSLNEKDNAYLGRYSNDAEKLLEMNSNNHCEAYASGSKQGNLSIDSPPIASSLFKASSTPNP